MQMNQSQRVERTRGAVDDYVGDIEVPQYDADAVAARMNVRTQADTMPRLRRWPTTALAAGAACAIVALFIIASPAVLGQVERMLQAFATINGQTVPVEVNSVTLDQARSDMPFAVIAPAAIPPGLTERIDELNPNSSRLDSHLLIRFSNGDGPTVLTIMERSVHAAPPVRMRLWMTTGPNVVPAAPPLPRVPPGQHMFVQFNHNGQVLRQIRVEPISWVVRGTRVDLISPPGFLSPMQIAAIRRAMAH